MLIKHILNILEWHMCLLKIYKRTPILADSYSLRYLTAWPNLEFARQLFFFFYYSEIVVVLKNL